MTHGGGSCSEWWLSREGVLRKLKHALKLKKWILSKYKAHFSRWNEPLTFVRSWVLWKEHNIRPVGPQIQLATWISCESLETKIPCPYHQIRPSACVVKGEQGESIVMKSSPNISNAMIHQSVLGGYFTRPALTPRLWGLTAHIIKGLKNKQTNKKPKWNKTKQNKPVFHYLSHSPHLNHSWNLHFSMTLS